MSGEKILVVDDDEEVVYFCVQTLESEGYTVKGVNNGQLAMELAKDDNFDLLLTDIMMPGLNGIEVFKAIKKIDPGLVGVVITGHGTLYTAVDALNVGFHGFITKPFKSRELSRVVSQALERNRLEKELIAYRKIDTLVDNFLAIVSHELRTPLSLILISIDQIFNARWEKAGKKEREVLNVLKNEGNRFERLISNILLYSELKFQKIEHPRKPIDIKNIISKIVDSVKEDARKKNITIDNQTPSSLPSIIGVGKYMRQMIANFLDNAIKFNREGGKVIIRGKKERNYIRIEVTDTGIGIAEREYDIIFDPFLQLEDPMTRKVGGTGLGLAINKEIIEAHGGEIWVESVIGKGSKFIFAIPINDM
ncbi:MAG: response regulator [Thermodesulfobacteriota bacterium]|nr:response regulator [Thermodesulfobacteriota bacterium]